MQLADLAKKTKKKREEQREGGGSSGSDSALEALRKRAGKKPAEGSGGGSETHTMGPESDDSDRPKRESYQSDSAYRAAHAEWQKKQRKKKAEDQARAIEK